jgi:hypothetical protein
MYYLEKKSFKSFLRFSKDMYVVTYKILEILGHLLVICAFLIWFEKHKGHLGFIIIICKRYGIIVCL